MSIRIPLYLAFIASVSILRAHEQPTHQNLTSAALNYINANDPMRAKLLQAYGPNIISTVLADGAWNEDSYFPPSLFLGRFFFHFLPSLNDLGQFGSCSSVDWGINALSCTAVGNAVVGGTTVTATDDHTWKGALAAVDQVTGAPTLLGWRHLGYVIHLLEDLTSPPHTRNSAHPCAGGLFFCDPFEPDNEGVPVNLPKSGSDYVGVSNLTGPQDLFSRVRNYTHDGYFSARTVFDTTPPMPVETSRRPGLYPRRGLLLCELSASINRRWNLCSERQTNCVQRVGILPASKVHRSA